MCVAYLVSDCFGEFLRELSSLHGTRDTPAVRRRSDGRRYELRLLVTTATVQRRRRRRWCRRRTTAGGGDCSAQRRRRRRRSSSSAAAAVFARRRRFIGRARDRQRSARTPYRLAWGGAVGKKTSDRRTKTRGAALLTYVLLLRAHLRGTFVKRTWGVCVKQEKTPGQRSETRRPIADHGTTV